MLCVWVSCSTVTVMCKARIVWLWPMISSRTSQHDDIVALTWHNDIVVVQYHDYEGDQLHTWRVQSVGPYNLTLTRPDRPWWAVTTAAAVQEEESRDWHHSEVVSFLADSDDEQDGAEPANGPWNFATISLYCRRISHDITIQKIPTIRAVVMCGSMS